MVPRCRCGFQSPGLAAVSAHQIVLPYGGSIFFYARIGRIYTECSTWRKAALDDMTRIRPDIVLMSSAETVFTPDEWREGSARVMRSLSRSVAHVYVLRATPTLPFDGPDCLAVYAQRQKWLTFGAGCNAPNTNARSDSIYASLRQAAARYGNVQVLDMNDLICFDGICHAQQNGIVVFRDSQHMTATFAASLASTLAKRLLSDALRE